MKYDFESIIDRRSTGSHKWEAMAKLKPDVGEGIVPLSVADMEFYNPPELIEGLKQHLDKTVLGYTGPTEEYFSSVCSWMERRHGFRPEPEWIVQTAGVVPALFKLVTTFTQEGDGIIIFSPVYYPFALAVEGSGRRLVRSSLGCTGLRYEIDFDDFTQKAADPNVKMCIFCSPHNPVGRVWTKEEVERVAVICRDNGVLLVSDEIHNDLIMKGYQHVSAGTLEKSLLNNTIICTAPSKTFNLAGMQSSNIIIADPLIRERMQTAQGYFSLNALGYKACQLAYDLCEDWLMELLKVIDDNKRTVEDFMKRELPVVVVYPLEGTYLQWWDLRGLGLEYHKMERFLVEKAELFTDDGSLFGEEGCGFFRVNLACPKKILSEALERLETALKSAGIV